MIRSLTLISSAIISSFGGISNSIQKTESISVAMTPTEANDFIYQRTFSLAKQITPTTAGFGTGWLLKHITGESSNYKYYLMTNWHVSNSMPSDIHFRYATTNTVDAEILGYSPLIAGNANWNNASYWNESGTLLGVDASLIEVDFASRTASDANLKSRLDALNTYGANGHDNFMFNGFSNFNDLNTGNAFYTGGYPLRDWSEFQYDAPQWESGTDTIANKWNYFNNKRENHGIDTNGKIISIANGYVTNFQSVQNGPLFKLGGGGSGSMMIDANGNLLGLYWGGLVHKNYSGAITGYETAFEAFTWGEHNLFNDYLNNEWIPTIITKNWWGLIGVGIACVCAIGIGTTIYLVRKNGKGKKKN